MSEITSPAACTAFEWEAAKQTGLLTSPPLTTAWERSLHAFAAAVRADEKAAICKVLQDVNAAIAPFIRSAS
ncbi:hypothetical protein [Methylibium sp.]|uniref:hypothetical protein n=1 Tax=Methylibium sp. TaxID=2067992 RepID=UPI003D0F77A3